MDSFLRKIWVVLFAFMIFGMLAWVPVGKYQRAYMAEFHRIKAKPQKRIEETYKMIDAIEDGAEIPQQPQIVQNPPPPPKPINKGKRKPFFIRDKRDARILYPYKD